MRLADEVCEQIQAFIDGCLAPHELAGWLDSVADEVHVDDSATRHLTGQAYILLAELGYGDRTIKDVREELSGLVGGQVTRASVGGAPQETVTGSDAQLVTRDVELAEWSSARTIFAEAYG